jgi:hypothetical protein
MYLCTIIFGILLQNSIRNPNCHKVGQLTKKFRKRLDGWTKPMEGEAKGCQVFQNIVKGQTSSCHIKELPLNFYG